MNFAEVGDAFYGWGGVMYAGSALGYNCNRYCNSPCERRDPTACSRLGMMV